MTHPEHEKPQKPDLLSLPADFGKPAVLGFMHEYPEELSAGGPYLWGSSKYSGIESYPPNELNFKGIKAGDLPETLGVPTSKKYIPGIYGAKPGEELYSSAVPTPHDSKFSIALPPGLRPNGEHRAENHLVDSFASLLAKVSFADALVPMRKSRPVIDRGQFRFVPIRRERAGAGYNVAVPEGIRTTYKGQGGGKPYLDTPRAIGLVYGDWLVAVGGAQVQQDGGLLVKQLQDVTNVRRGAGPEQFAQTGLRNGFWWRDTLVVAWEKIAGQLGLTDVIIQSNRNNMWVLVQQAGGRGYDDVARRRHYDLEASTGNWIKKIRD